jgi:hypothetical protein
MKRFLALAIALGLIAPVALVGCGEETKPDANKPATSTPAEKAPDKPADTAAPK